MITVRNPYTGEELARRSFSDLEGALSRAASAFVAMRSASRYERSSWCSAVAGALRARSEEFVGGIVAESGKPVRFARDEVRRAISTFELAASYALTFVGEVVPLDVGATSAGYVGYTSRVPVGPVAAITPFNFPLNLVAHKVAPALAVGCPVLLKPAPATPLTAELLASVMPAGAFCEVLHLDVPSIQALCTDSRVRFVSFTGSARVGWELKKLVWDKRVALELGGNAAVIVHSDADLDWAVQRIAVGGYAYAGQVCISVQRVYVHESVYDEFRSRYLKAVASLGVGDPSLESTVVGPLIRPAEVSRLSSWIAESGASVLCGGTADGPVFAPTVLESVPLTSRLHSEEVFGPLTSLYRYSSFPSVLEAVNDSVYGLQVGVFTSDISRILAAHSSLEMGGVIINDFPTFRVDNMPYGGVKQSGFGREGVRYTMEEMTEIRLLAICNRGVTGAS